MIRKRNNRRLYESIMKDVAKNVKRHLNESNINLNNAFYRIIFGYENYLDMSISDVLNDNKVLAKIAGYIVEARIKNVLTYIFTHNTYDDNGYFAGAKMETDANGLPRFVDGGNNWWDFSLDGEKVEIKAFQKGKLYSNVHATANQKEYKDQLTFMLVEYEYGGGEVVITGIAFVDGSKLTFDEKYDRLVRNPAIKFKKVEDFEDIELDDTDWE